MASHDAMVEASGVLKVLSTSLIKMANDIRLLGCHKGPAWYRAFPGANESQFVDGQGGISPATARYIVSAVPVRMTWKKTGHLQWNNVLFAVRTTEPVWQLRRP
jgi:aspartate ammonia-lyase